MDEDQVSDRLPRGFGVGDSALLLCHKTLEFLSQAGVRAETAGFMFSPEPASQRMHGRGRQSRRSRRSEVDASTIFPLRMVILFSSIILPVLTFFFFGSLVRQTCSATGAPSCDFPFRICNLTIIIRCSSQD